MAAVARSAGVSVGSIYQYFASKDDVLDAATMALFDHIIDLAEPAFTAAEPTPDDLREVYREILAHHQKHLPAYRFLRRRDRDRGDTHTQRFQEKLIERSVSMTIRAGRAVDEEAALSIVTDLIRAMGGLIAAVLLYDETDIDEDRLVERFVALTTALAPEVSPP